MGDPRFAGTDFREISRPKELFDQPADRIGRMLILEAHPDAKTMGPLPEMPPTVIGPAIGNMKGIGLEISDARPITVREQRQAIGFLRAAREQLRLAQHHLAAAPNRAANIDVFMDELKTFESAVSAEADINFN